MSKENLPVISKYEVIEKIGEGPLGEVYKVKEKKNSKMYSAKILQISLEKEDDDNSKTTKEILRQTKKISKFKHPSLAKFIHFSPVDFQGNRKSVLISELMSKGTLAEIIKDIRNGNKDLNSENWTDTRKLIILYSIASAMSYLHSYKIIHRHLKLENILIDEYSTPKITDFFLSKYIYNNSNTVAMDSITKNIKSIFYVPPEALSKLHFTKEGDVYSFSIIAYQLFSNEDPFAGCSFEDIKDKIVNGKRPEFNFPIPDSYKELIEKCWSQEPSERPTFDQIVNELKSDPGFITESVVKDDYLDYIQSTESQIIFSSHRSKQRISLSDSLIDSSHGSDEQSEDNIIKDYSVEDTIIKKDIDNEIEKEKEREKEKSSLEDESKSSDEPDEDDPFLIAERFYNGDENQEPDKREASKFYKIAADKGNVTAMYRYSVMNRTGDGIPINRQEGSIYCKLAADKGNVDAMFAYASTLFNKSDSAHYYKMAADNGHKDAMFKYSVMLANGEGVEIDKVKSAYYCKLAADNGLVESMYVYAIKLKTGDGVPTNTKEALIYYKKAADNGHRESMHNYAVAVYNGDGVPCNKKEASKYFKMAADEGHTDSMRSYYLMLQNGDGIEADPEEAKKYHDMALTNGQKDVAYERALELLEKAKEEEKKRAEALQIKVLEKKPTFAAISSSSSSLSSMSSLEQIAPEPPKTNKSEIAKYFKIAADNGHIEAMYKYALMKEKGDGVSIDLEEAAKYYRNAAENGQINAIHNYGIMLYKGFGVPINKTEAARYFKMAASQGIVTAMYNYAIMLKTGVGVPVDKKEAAKYFKMAADHGDMVSIRNYALMVSQGDGVPVNKAEAAPYFKIIADVENDIKFIYDYALMLKIGDGVPVNKREAAKYFKIGADMGHLESIYNYAYLLDYGHGVKMDKEEAIKLYKVAADRGHVEAMFDYAMKMYSGDGAKVNKKVAAYYYKMAADNGQMEAMYNYGMMLKNGDGIRINLTESERYLGMAEAKK